jgi:hypothetical protein
MAVVLQEEGYLYNTRCKCSYYWKFGIDKKVALLELDILRAAARKYPVLGGQSFV